MENSIKHALLALLVLYGSTSQAVAEPVQVNITGRIIASPCTVDTTQSNLNVDLGDIPATDLATAGTYGGPEKFFNIVLKDCPLSTTRVVATFSGLPYVGDNTKFANTGTATGVGVKIKTRAESYTSATVHPDGATWSLPVERETNSVSYAFATRAYTSTGNAMPGTIVSTMQVAFTYQ